MADQRWLRQPSVMTAISTLPTPGDTTGLHDDDPQARKRTANDFMRQGLQRLDSDEPIPFLCECDHADCFATIWLKGMAFDRIRAERSAPIIAHLHGAAAGPYAVG